MSYNKSTTEQRFSKTLIIRQLQAVLPDWEEHSLEKAADDIISLWSKSHNVVELRPRWFKHPHSGGQTLLVSSFSESYGKEQPFKQLNMVIKGDVYFACPIPKLVLEKIGPWKVSKILIRGGLPYLFDVIKRREDYQEMLVNESVIAFVNEFLKDLDSDLEEI